MKIKVGKNKGALMFNNKTEEIWAHIPSDDTGMPSSPLGEVFAALSHRLVNDAEFTQDMLDYFDDNVEYILGVD